LVEGTAPLDAAIEARLISACRAGHLLELLREEDFYHKVGGVEPIGPLLADLHNNGTFDLLAAFSAENLRAIPPGDFFDVQVAFCAALPHLVCDVQSLSPVITNLVRMGGADLAANRPFTVFRKWLGASRERTEKALACVLSDLDIDRGILRFALSGIASFDRKQFFEVATRLVSDARPYLSWATLSALADIDVSDQADDTQRVVDILCDAIRSAPDDDYFANALGAFLMQHHRGPVKEDTVVEIFTSACSRPSPGVRYLLAGRLMSTASAVPARAGDSLIELFATTPSAEKATLEFLDVAFAQADWNLHRRSIVRMLDGIVGRETDTVGISDCRQSRLSLSDRK
jgi:hypothetical protein